MTKRKTFIKEYIQYFVKYYKVHCFIHFLYKVEHEFALALDAYDRWIQQIWSKYGSGILFFYKATFSSRGSALLLIKGWIILRA